MAHVRRDKVLSLVLGGLIVATSAISPAASTAASLSASATVSPSASLPAKPVTQPTQSAFGKPFVPPMSVFGRTATEPKLTTARPLIPAAPPNAKPRIKTSKKWVVAGKRAVVRVTNRQSTGVVRWQTKPKSTSKWRALTSADAITKSADRLTIKVTKKRDGTRYRAISFTGRPSNTLRLRVITKPKITQQPASRTVRPGSSFTLRITATGGKLRYQWSTRIAAGASWKRVPRATKKRLTIKRPTGAWTQYRVVVRNQQGRALSRTATITVNSANSQAGPGKGGQSGNQSAPGSGQVPPGGGDSGGPGTAPGNPGNPGEPGEPNPDPTFPDPPPPAPYKPQITYAPKPAGYPSVAQQAIDEQTLTQQSGSTQAGENKVFLMRSALRVRTDAVVDHVIPGHAANPSNVRRVEQIIPQATFDHLFPVRNTAYSYVNLLRAIAKFPAYCDTYTDGRDSDAICRKLLATSFAHLVQETGGNYPSLTPAVAIADFPANTNPVLHTMAPHDAIPTYRQALWYLREISYTEQSRGAYAECYPGGIIQIFNDCGRDAQNQPLSYFGRGAKQLSYNYNYGQFSKSLYGDPNVLLDDPARVADTWLNIASAIWFAVYLQSPKPPMTWVIDGTWQPNQVDLANNMSPGFGATIQIINGGVECGQGGMDKPQVLNRIAAYQQFAAALNVPIPPSESLGCASSQGFTAGSAAATQVYLDQDWSWNPSNPAGKSYRCQTVAYQTPFILAVPGDYTKCVDYFFRGQVRYQGQLVVDNS